MRRLQSSKARNELKNHVAFCKGSRDTDKQDNSEYRALFQRLTRQVDTLYMALGEKDWVSASLGREFRNAGMQVTAYEEPQRKETL